MNPLTRIANRWRRVFHDGNPLSWERKNAAALLKQVSDDPWACAALAEILEIEIDAGESAADYVSQTCRAHYNSVVALDLERRLNSIRSER